MLRATLRSLLTRKLRLALSAIAIVLGVAFVSGTLIFTDTLSRTFTQLVSATAADVNVTRAAAFDAGFAATSAGQQPQPIPASALAAVQATDGVKTASGYVQTEGVYVLDRNGKVLNTGGAPGVGVSFDTDPELSVMHLTAGREPRNAGEVALDTTTIERTGYHVGESVRLLTPGPSVEAKLVGIFRYGNTGGLAGASLTAFPLDSAQRLFGKPGTFSGISVKADEGVAPETLKARVAAALGSGYDVKTGAEQTADVTSAINQGLRFINVFLLVFAAVALFVGSFIILNTFSMLVAQRSRELALLRAIGASRGQVTRSVLLEALILGVVGSTAGLLTGFLIAFGLRAIFNRFGLTLDGALVFGVRTVIWSYAVGVLVTLVAAYLPARRASKVPPIAAMRDEVSLPEKNLRRRGIAGAVLVILAVGSLATGLNTDDGTRAAALVGLGAYVLVVAAILLSPVLSRPFLRVFGAVLPRLFGKTGQLARENALRNPRRTAATASALMVGLTLVTAFSVIGSSTNKSVDALVDATLGADYVVSTAVGQPFSPEIAAKIAGVDGVSQVAQERLGIAQFNGRQSFFSAVDPQTLDSAVRASFVSGSGSSLAGGALAVDEKTAQAHDWQVGTTVPVLFESGERRTLPVGGIFKANQALGPITLGLDTYEKAGGSGQDRYVYVVLDDNADTDAVKTQLDQILAPYPVVQLKDQTAFKEEQKGQVGQLLLLVNALLVLSVLIAVLGIVNTLALSVIERTREIGLLRAIGMARSQLRRMIRLESVLIAVYGAILGVILGLTFGVSLTRSLASQGIEELAIPGGRLVLLVVVAGVVGVLAAVWPARRAARLDVLRAVTTE